MFFTDSIVLLAVKEDCCKDGSKQVAEYVCSFNEAMHKLPASGNCSCSRGFPAFERAEPSMALKFFRTMAVLYRSWISSFPESTSVLFSSQPNKETVTGFMEIFFTLKDKMVAGKPEFNSSNAMNGEY